MEKERPRPTRQLIYEVCGGNTGLLRAAHHGLEETPLNGFYPSLDLKELIGFAASSWKGREEKDQMIGWKAQTESFYDLFSYVFKIGMPWVNKHLDISGKRDEVYGRLNPFGGVDLKGRLLQYEESQEGVQLVERLNRPVKEYITEAQNEHLSRFQMSERKGNVVVMTFLPYSVGKNPEHVPFDYANEISRIIRKYPRAINPLVQMEKSSEQRQVEGYNAGQLGLSI